MLLIIGYIVVLGAILGGFTLAGGKLILLLHVSEFVVIGGVSLGVMIIASSKEVLISIINDIKMCLKGGGSGKAECIDVLKILYEFFMISRKSGIIALDEHMSEPENSAIFKKYPNFLAKKDLVEFVVNAFRPIIDGRIKPEQIGPLLEADIDEREDSASQSPGVLSLIGDSLPGIGIVAAVLGIINTMNAISEGPETVGAKVAAALTGTFLGVLGAYGFVNPLTKRIQSSHRDKFMLFRIASVAITENCKGVVPLMAIEMARRHIDPSFQPDATELEEMLKEAIKK